MKLLDPRTIQSNLNSQRKSDIDQGLTLARKVDTLRETLSVEEAKITAFRDATIKEVQKQIDAKIKERDVLAQEIEDAQKVHDHLSLLLDKEWGEVDVEKEQLSFLQKRIDGLQKEAETKIAEVEKQLKEIEVEKQRQQFMREQIEKQAEQSSNILTEAQDRFAKAIDEESRVAITVRKKTRKLDEREAILQATVNDIALREQRIKEDEQYIINEKIKIADQRATLGRAMARLQK
jgi:hypothetical protein